ncbi:histidine phosphatase family protein [Actinophytocola algeriensis]|uniref:Putative phosphomutase (TIGR03848 family) n=1 Tax=Actinophytocola algeriensis TaxID=1768010 RepID=A0A7W7QBU3_9PSEU|nr:histidine phosphatase family protein [Actinophytocola algeriensis]MBB4910704.1 putative phosphomutase (TIGR03848 family) [Actinophytocola algeriensis]MBE1473697.1 putative phosphomutase (TIGR03848 family) [Actinophytocola algeriensis]
MATVVLLRHARSTANGSGVLAGRTPGVELDETGRKQADALVARLDTIPVAEIVCSPLLRCEQTVAPIAAARGLAPVTEPNLSEVDYGDWTNRELTELGKEKLWSVVQQHPSAAVFPGGEGLASVQTRAVAAVRAHDARISAAHGAEAVWLLCSHGDVLKAILADALGQHLDTFQRIVVNPASVSVVQYTETRPFVLRMNDNGGELASIVPTKPQPAEPDGPRPGDAVPGGDTGRSS